MLVLFLFQIFFSIFLFKIFFSIFSFQYFLFYFYFFFSVLLIFPISFQISHFLFVDIEDMDLTMGYDSAVYDVWSIPYLNEYFPFISSPKPFNITWLKGRRVSVSAKEK